jgi:hypothetical protein
VFLSSKYKEVLKLIKYIRWSAWVILGTLVVAALVPIILIAHGGKAPAAYAAGTTPSITVPAILHPFDTITITGQGFVPFDDVEIALDYSNNPIGGIHCDGNGNCSGQVNIPYTGLTQGTYPVIATGATGLTTQVSAILLPGIATFVPSNGVSSSLTSGGPGTPVQLEGGGFNANEALTLSWGKNNAVSLRNVTTSFDGSFSLQINAPVPAAPGYNPINVVRSKQTPAKVTTSFHILPPKMISSAGIHNGQAAHVKLSGFAANEQVTLSWNANSGQTITTVTIDSIGVLDTYIAPQSAPKGAYTLQAVGSTSQLQAQSSLTIGPGILLSPNTLNPGGTTVAVGGGFTPGEKVNVYFQNTSNGMTPATVDASGSFSVSLAVPAKYFKNVTYHVYAISTTTADSAKAQFYYTTPSIQLTCCNSPTYGDSFTLDGQGFTPQELVKITAQNTAQQYPVILGTATVTGDGTLTFTSTMPGAPNVPSAAGNGINMYMYATDIVSRLKASTSFDALPNVIPTPGSAQIGQTVALQGGGFGSKETVSIQFQDTQVATAKTDNNGTFKATIIIPASAQAEYFPCNLCVTGNMSGATVDAAFTFLPTITISPQKGPSGTSIIVKGVGLDIYDAMNIYWFDPKTKMQTLLTSFGMNGSNSFQVTVTAPSNLTSGKTYDVQIEGGSGLIAQLPFKAT